MRAVDTNVVVRLITRDDARQTQRAEAFVAKGAWVSHVVLAEVVWVLDSVYALTDKQLALTIEMLLNHRDMVLQDPEVVLAALSNYRKRPKLGFSDCLVLEAARKVGHLPLGTFDRELARLDDVDRI